MCMEVFFVNFDKIFKINIKIFFFIILKISILFNKRKEKEMILDFKDNIEIKKRNLNRKFYKNKLRVLGLW